MDLRNLADRAGAEIVNGINAANPDHVPFENIGLVDKQPSSSRETGEIELFGKLTAGTGAFIAIGSAAFEAAGVGGEEVMKLGVGAGLGGIAVGAAVYAMGRFGR